jgi:hypothetical protein
MDLNDARVFVGAAHAGTLSDAARDLEVPTSARSINHCAPMPPLSGRFVSSPARLVRDRRTHDTELLHPERSDTFDSLPMHPFPYIAGAMTQFQRGILARDQEPDDIQIDKCHFRQVQNDPSLGAVDVSPQLADIVSSNAADQTNGRVCRVRQCLDPQHKMGNPLAFHPYHRRAANVDVCGDLIRLGALPINY